MTSSANSSLSLNGVSAYVEAPGSETLNIAGPITLEAWVKTNAINTQQGIVERYNLSNVNDGGYALRITADGRLAFITVRSSSEIDIVTGASFLPIGTWVHVAGVFDGTQLRVYINGILDGSKASQVSQRPSSGSLKIGGRGDDASFKFNGLIDEVRMTSGARYEADFTPYRHLSAGGVVESFDGANTRGLWNFEDQTANDSSGNNNHGSLVGGAGFSQETTNHLEQAGAPATTAASETPVLINFNGFGNGVFITNQFPQATFSSSQGFFAATYADFDYGTPLPSLSRGNTFGWNHFVPLAIDFTKPANNLKFKTLASNQFGLNALIDVYQNGKFTTTLSLNGNARPFVPIPTEIGGLGYNNVSRIVIYNVIDLAGLAFDDFSFTVPTPTPTRRPRPRPRSR